ncbi:hypothetical protein ABK040_007494 [Willaertia magna]
MVLHPMNEEYRDPTWLLFITDCICFMINIPVSILKKLPLIGKLMDKYWLGSRSAPMTAKTNPPPRPNKLNPPETKELFDNNSTEPRKKDLTVVRRYNYPISEIGRRKWEDM